MPTFNRRTVLTGTACAMLGAHPFAWAKYPDKAVKIIVPWAPGGSTDAIARALAQSLTETTKQTFLVDNKPGAAAQIGTDAAAKSAPDGYTLALSSCRMPLPRRWWPSCRTTCCGTLRPSHCWVRRR